jgi:hypothetical protein
VQRVTGEPVKSVALDGNYNKGDIIKLVDAMGIELLCPEDQAASLDPARAKPSKFGRADFVHHVEGDFLTCPQGRKLPRVDRWTPAKTTAVFRKYASPDCSGCPFSARCLGRARTRSVTLTDYDDIRTKLRERMAAPQNRNRCRRRMTTVEPTHGEQKHIQHMQRFGRRGLAKVRLEYSLDCMAHNLRRYSAIRRR